MRNQPFTYVKSKAQISVGVTVKLISAFVFATRIVRFLFFLNLKFQASSRLKTRFRYFVRFLDLGFSSMNITHAPFLEEVPLVRS